MVVGTGHSQVKKDQFILTTQKYVCFTGIDRST